MRKMRKTLSFVLILALVLGSFSMAFGASSNYLNRTLTVSKDTLLEDQTIRVETNKNPVDWSGGTGRFQLELVNGTWETVASVASITRVGGGAVVTPVGIVTTVTSKTILELEVRTNTITDAAFDINLGSITAGKKAGAVIVKINGKDSDVTSGDYVIATVAGGATSVRIVEDAFVTAPRTTVTGPSIVIEETAIGSVNTTGAATFELRLPANMSWGPGSSKGSIVAFGTTVSSVISVVDPGTLIITMGPNVTNAVRTSFVLTNYSIIVGKDARLGDVSLLIRDRNADVTNTSLVIGKVSDELVTVYVDLDDDEDLPEFYAGRGDGVGRDYEYVAKITVEENVPNALSATRYIDFTFPSGVEIVTGEAIIVKADGTQMAFQVTQATNQLGEIFEDLDGFEWEVPARPVAATAYTFEIPIAISGTFEGDIELNVAGAKAGVDETDVVVATVVNPIKVETKITDVRTGIKGQATADITISEVEAGAIIWDGNTNLAISLNDRAGLGIATYNFNDATVELVSGDGTINEKDAGVDNTGLFIDIPITRDSVKEPMVIKVSGVEVNLDRTVPEGKLVVDFGDDALIDFQAGQVDLRGRVARVDYLNVITPADAYLYREATFVIGSDKYMVLEDGVWVEKTMDTAPYITDNRTLVPMRYMGYALGLTDDDIVWNADTKTATFFGYNRVCVVTVGSKIMTVNGAQVPMDTTAKIKDGRVFVPFRFIANGLGASVSWDEDTKTITVKSGSNN